MWKIASWQGKSGVRCQGVVLGELGDLVAEGGGFFVVFGVDGGIEFLLEGFELLAFLVGFDHAFGDSAGVVGAFVHASEVVFDFCAEELVALAAAETAGFFEVVEGEPAPGADGVFFCFGWWGGGVGLFGMVFGCGFAGGLDVHAAEKEAIGIRHSLVAGAFFAQAGFLAHAVDNLGKKDGGLAVTVVALHRWG